MIFVQINCTIVEAEDIQDAHRFEQISDDFVETKHHRSSKLDSVSEDIMEEIMREIYCTRK